MPTNLPKISAPAQRALDSIGVATLEQLKDHSQKEIVDLHGIGPNAMAKLVQAMKAASIEFSKK
ncbi:MAG: hypothetical protein H7Y17_01815 [Chlorobia bacterium]|nr:hypothetical protein [Fimbriimonadaceae bacterium]